MWTEWHYNTIEGKCNLRGLWWGLYTFYQYTFSIFFVLFFCGMWFIIIPVLMILPSPIYYSIEALFNLIFYKFIKSLVAQNWVLKIWNDEKLILLIVIANKEGKKTWDETSCFWSQCSGSCVTLGNQERMDKSYL